MLLRRAAARYYRVNDGVKAVLAAILGIAFAAGCQPKLDAAPDVALNWAVAPDPLAVGPVAFTALLTDEETGQPIAGAAVKLQAMMSHPGMQPVFGAAREPSPGRYEASLDLTMAGDWILLVEAALPDGRTLRRQVSLQGVRARP